MSRIESHDESRWDEAMEEYWQQQESGDFDERAFLESFRDIREKLVEFLANRKRVKGHLVRPAIPVSSVTPPPPSFPREFGSYTLQREVGRGGMGVVYEAIQKNPRRRVGVKMILDSQLASSTDVQRFQKEAQTAAELHHPNIATIFEIGVYKRQHYFSMEYVNGETLSQKVRQTALSPEKAARYLKKVAETISFAHSKGVLHRDLTPSNILIDRQDQPKITDFGLTKRIDDPQQLTITGKFLGKPNYVSPEQADGKQLGPTSDVYSLGAVLYELLTGRPPFQGESIKDTLWMASHSEPVAPRRLNPKISKDIETICLHCLEKQPQKRYQSAQELADDLGRFLRNEPISARPVGAPERTWRWCQRNPVIASLLVAVVLTASIGAGGVLWQWGTATQALADMRAAQSQRIAAQVEALLTSEPEAVPTILDNLQPVRSEAVPRLRQLQRQPDLPKNVRVRVALGLLPDEPQKTDFLQSELLDLADAKEFILVRTMLAPYGRELAQPMWRESTDGPVERRFRAACALAAFDPHHPQWTSIVDDVVDALVSQESAQALQWLPALQPVREKLLPPLTVIFRDRERQESERMIATFFLAAYAADAPETLTRLIQDADAWQFSTLLPKLAPHRDQVVKLLSAQVRAPLPQSGTEDAGQGARAAAEIEEARDLSASRQANIAVALLHLGRPESVWPLLRHSEDPRVRTFLIHRLAAMEVDPRLLIDRLQSQSEASERRALLLALGEYQPERLGESRLPPLISDMSSAFMADPDPGVHSAIEWTLRRWGYNDDLAEMQSQLAREGPKSQRLWRVNSQGQTLAMIPGPVEFLMGAPDSERIGTKNNDPTFERQHRRRIPRTYAISTKEVTLREFLQFTEENPTTNYFYSSAIAPDDRGPATYVTWNEAALYCRWLSKKEGIMEDQICYKPQEATGECEPYPDYLSRTGYRLPTSAEWEFACRAGAVTPRFFGNDLAVIGQYAWTLENSNGRVWPVASLKPNDLGLFDVHGNVREWCQDFPGTYRRLVEVFTMESDDPVVDFGGGETGHYRAIRGGSFGEPRVFLRSAALEANDPNVRDPSLGFRIARTVETHLQEPVIGRSADPIRRPAPLSGRQPASAWKTLAVVRGAGINQLSQKLEYLLKLADHPPAVRQMFLQVREAVTQGHGLGTHDWWALAQSDGNDIAWVLLRPFASEADALASLAIFFPSQRRLPGGLYEFGGPAPQYFRFANGYGYLASHREQVEIDVPDPANLADPATDAFDVSVTISLETLPDKYAQALKAAGLATLVSEGRDIIVGLEISEATRQATVDLLVRPRPSTDLSRSIASLTALPSHFGALRDPDAAFRVGATLQLTPAMKKVLLRVLDEIHLQLLSELERAAEVTRSLKREGSIAHLELLSKVVAATIQNGRIDFMLELTEQGDGAFLSSAAVHLVEASRLAPVGVVDDASQDVEGLQVDHHHGWLILGGQTETQNPFLKAIFGSTHSTHLAFGDDVVALTQGTESRHAIERLIENMEQPSLTPAAASPFEMKWSLGKFLGAVDALENDFRRLAEVGAIRRKCFAQDDQIRLSIQPVHDGLRLRVEMEEGYLRFISEALASGFTKAAIEDSRGGE